MSLVQVQEKYERKSEAKYQELGISLCLIHSFMSDSGFHSSSKVNSGKEKYESQSESWLIHSFKIVRQSWLIHSLLLS